MGFTRPGERLQFAIENGPVEIVDFPMKNGGSAIKYLWLMIVNDSLRIHGAGIFTLLIGIMLNYINGANVGKYSSTMDPLGSS